MNRIEQIEIAEHWLRMALQQLKEAGCPRSADKVRSAIKSVGGAYRHAQGMATKGRQVKGLPTGFTGTVLARNPFLTVPDKSGRPEVPEDWPVRPVNISTYAPDHKAVIATCGECGRSWDDSIVTSMTPAPSARCPFEAFH